MDLGLSEEDFWRITPRMFVALMKRTEKRREMELNDLAVILCEIRNTVPRKGGPAKPSDFLPKKRKVKKSQEMLTVSRAINKSLGGKNG